MVYHSLLHRVHLREGWENEVKMNWRKKKVYKSLRITRLTICSFKHIPSIPAATLNLTPGAEGLSLDTPRHGNTHHITMTLQLVARLFVLEPQECSCCTSAVIPDWLGRCQVNVYVSVSVCVWWSRLLLTLSTGEGQEMVEHDINAGMKEMMRWNETRDDDTIEKWWEKRGDMMSWAEDKRNSKKMRTDNKRQEENAWDEQRKDAIKRWEIRWDEMRWEGAVKTKEEQWNKKKWEETSREETRRDER